MCFRLLLVKDMTKDAFLEESVSDCDLCGDTGFVVIDEDDGEGNIMVGTGTRKCLCQQDSNTYEPESND